MEQCNSKPSDYKLDLSPSEIIDAFISTKDAYLRSNLYNDYYILNNIIQNSQYSDFFMYGECDFFKGYAHFRESLLKYSQKNTSIKKSESATINTRIQSVLDMLGWYEHCDSRGEHPYSEGCTYSVSGINYELDLALCDNAHDASTIDGLSGEKKSKTSSKRDKINNELKTQIKKKVITILEAKAFKKLKNKKTQKTKSSLIRDTASAQGAEGQILEYLQSTSVQQGILTDGSKWKLFHKDLSDSDIIRNLSFDLENLLRDARRISNGEMNIFPYHFETAARIFYFFFSKESHDYQRSDLGVSVIQQISNSCLSYVDDLDEILKGRFMEAMNITCNGFMATTNDEELFTCEDGRKFVRNCTESFLFNLLFVKSCEMNSVLPVEQPEYRSVMVTSVVNKLLDLDPSYLGDDVSKELETKCKIIISSNYSATEHDLYDKIIKNFKEIYDGNTSLKIDGFKEDVFTAEEWAFVSESKINNNDMVRILYKLSCLYRDGESQLIPYNYLTPRQFGEVYESFLEFKLEFADKNYYFNSKKKQLLPLKSWDADLLKNESFRVKKGNLFFTPNNKDRKMTGSYYTPDYIVKYIVKNTLKDIVESKKDFTDILDISVCDPAMGSGHFLSYSLKYLTKQYRLKYLTEHGITIDESFNVSARKILDSCIFGADNNPSAVKLSKLTLWLSSAHRGKKLERLDDQLADGDSLIELDWSKRFPKVFKKEGFDAIVGNPPYIRIQGRGNDKYSDFESAIGNYDIYCLFLEKSLGLLNPLGRMGFIVPHRFMKTDYGEGIRKFIGENNNLVKIVDFDGFMVFDQASINTSVLLFDKNISSTSISVEQIKGHKYSSIEMQNHLFKSGNSSVETLSGKVDSKY